MDLSIRDVAKALDVSERTVFRWIEEDDLPAVHVNEQFHVNRAELLEWATMHRKSLSPKMFEPESWNSDVPPSLADAIQVGSVHYDVPAIDAPGALRELVRRMPIEESERDMVWELMVRRESIRSTGIGGGIGLPHPRRPVVCHLSEPAITVCFFRQPIDFQAPDGQPVHTLFGLLSPTQKIHLQLLARLAWALTRPGFRGAIDRRAPREEIVAEARKLRETQHN
ncbi:MAG: PTS sugar transporter subunit IIA [Planctomycetota bacterium]